jgi:hypothetical protein
MNAGRIASTARVFALPSLGLIVGLAVAGLVRTDHPSSAAVVYHGRYVPLDGVTISRAYRSTLTLSYPHHSGPSALLIGAAIGLLAGIAVALVLDRLSGSWPSGSARR